MDIASVTMTGAVIRWTGAAKYAYRRLHTLTGAGQHNHQVRRLCLNRIHCLAMQALVMTDLPFAITPEAEAHIERVLLEAQRNLKLLSMARVLGYAMNCSWTDPEGKGGWYPFAHILLGWHPVDEVVGNSDYTELELAGFRMFAHQGSIKRLCGKRIVLDKGKGAAGGDMLAVR